LPASAGITARAPGPSMHKGGPLQRSPYATPYPAKYSKSPVRRRGADFGPRPVTDN